MDENIYLSIHSTEKKLHKKNVNHPPNNLLTYCIYPNAFCYIYKRARGYSLYRFVWFIYLQSFVLLCKFIVLIFR